MTGVRVRLGSGLLAALVALSALTGLAGADDDAGQLLAGAAATDITWRAGAGQSGWGERWRFNHLDNQGIDPNMSARMMKPSEGIHMPLRAKALVMEQDDRRFALVSLDLLGAIQLLHVAVLQEVGDELGIAWENLLITGTHTEAGPSNGSPSPLVSLYADFMDEDFARHVVNQTAEAIRVAASRLEPVTVGIGSRDGIEQIGSFVRPDQPDYHLDLELGVARLDRLDGSTAATVLVYPGHFNLGGNPATLISPDGPGYVERMTEDALAARPEQGDQPVTALFLPGPLGDSAVTGSGAPNIYANTEERARKLFSHTWDLLTSIEPAQRTVVDSAAVYINPPTDYQVPRFPILQGAPTPFMVSHRMHVQVLRIGDLFLGGVPGEPVMWLSGDYKTRVAELGVPHPFMVSFGNDWTGYIYTRNQWHEQVSRSDQGAYGPEQGHLINDALVELTKALLGVPFELAPGTGGPAQAADDPFYSSFARALRESEPVGGPARDAAVVPDVVRECTGLGEPADIDRFERTALGWRGGNPAADLPHVTLEREVAPDQWEPAATSDGFELRTWLDLYYLRPADPSPGSSEPGCNELASSTWAADFEPAFDWPAGTYRLRAEGVFRTAPTIDEPYEVVSDPFVVRPSNQLSIDDLVVTDAGVSFTVSYPVDADGWRWRPEQATTGGGEVLVDGTFVGTASYDAEVGAFVLDTPVLAGQVEIHFTDAWGNTATG